MDKFQIETKKQIHWCNIFMLLDKVQIETKKPKYIGAIF